MQRISARTAISLSALALFVSSGMLYAGPLNPPAGPVASTFKTLTEVEPRIAINATNTPGAFDCVYKITQPGSYYLTGNMTGVAGKHGIVIASSGVTVDLNGFEVVGVPGMGLYDGVTGGMGGLTNIEVKNGSVRGWGSEGVDLGTVNTANSRIVDVRSSDNAGFGIAAGSAATVLNCSSRNNGGNGISSYLGSTISNCLAFSNGAIGIATTETSIVENCVAAYNTGTGILATNGTRVVDCVARENRAVGIDATVAVSISGCTLVGNTSDGIRAFRRCTITHNTCIGNGPLTADAAGIHITSTGNHVSDNDCLDNDRGVDVDSPSNFINRNTSAGNVNNWDVVAGNVCFVVLGNTSGAITGNSGGIATGAIDPNANFSY